jgi:hypothetical protein
MDAQVIVLTLVDEEGFMIEPVIVHLFDENGEPITELPANLVPPNQKSLATPRWDFEMKQWVEGDASKALEHARKMLMERYNSECNQYIEKGFYYNGNLFAFSMVKDQPNFAQQMTFLLLRPDITTLQWKTENNGVKNFTRDEFFSICQAGEIHKRQNIAKYWSLKEYVNTLESIEEIENMPTFEEAVKYVS